MELKLIISNPFFYSFLNSHIIDQLKLGLPKYLTSAGDIYPTQDLLCGGMQHISHSGQTTAILLLQSSSHFF